MGDGRDPARFLASRGSRALRLRRRRRPARCAGGSGARALRERAGNDPQVAASGAVGRRIIDLEYPRLQHRLLDENPTALHAVLESVHVAQRLQRLDQRHILQADRDLSLQAGIEHDRIAGVARQCFEHLRHRQSDDIQVEARLQRLAGKLRNGKIGRWQELPRDLGWDGFGDPLGRFSQTLTNLRQQGGIPDGGRRRRCARRQQQGQTDRDCGQHPRHQPGPARWRRLALVRGRQANQPSVEGGM